MKNPNGPSIEQQHDWLDAQYDEFMAESSLLNGNKPAIPAMTIQGLLFSRLPRGTFRAVLNPIEIDVWAEYGKGWRYTLTHSQTGFAKGYSTGFSSFEIAAEAAINQARIVLHPLN